MKPLLNGTGHERSDCMEFSEESIEMVNRRCACFLYWRVVNDARYPINHFSFIGQVLKESR